MERDLDREPLERSEPLARERTLEVARALELSREREVVRDNNRVWRVSDAEHQLLWDIGRFRTVAVDDLLKYAYAGRGRELRDDLRSLSAQGLVRRRRALMRNGQGSLDVLVLTQAARHWLEREHGGGQAVYAGFVKASEVAHDAAIYRMFHAEAKRIERQGGTLKRVVLDYELKRQAYAPLAKARALPRREFAARQTEIARKVGLSIIDGRLVLPDLRIEYIAADGHAMSVDLELATGHYHGSHLRAKAQAGFRMYVADGSESRLSRVMEEHEIAATLLAL